MIVTVILPDHSRVVRRLNPRPWSDTPNSHLSIAWPEDIELPAGSLIELEFEPHEPFIAYFEDNYA